MAAAGALIAALDMARHALTEQRVKGHAVGGKSSESGTVLTTVTQEHHRSERLLEALGRSRERLVEVLVGNAGRFGQIVAAQVLAEAEVQEGHVIGLQATARRGGQGDELTGLNESSGRTAALFEGFTELHGIFGKGSGPFTCVGVALVSGNREEPCPHPFGFTELRQPRRGPDEHLVGDVGSIVRRTGQAGAEVVQLRPEPVIQLTEGVTIPLRGACRHIGVTGNAEGPGHRESLGIVTQGARGGREMDRTIERGLLWSGLFAETKPEVDGRQW